MATIFLDDQTAARTYVARFTQDSNGYIWDGVDSFDAPNTFTDAELKTAIELVTLTAVTNESSTHVGYMLTIPAGITTPCHISLYLTSYTAGDAEDYGYDYDPQNAQILADTNELQTNQGSWATATSTTCSDKTGFSLAATGLDAITVTEPSGKPTTFPGWIMWLIQRFRRSSKTPTSLFVQKESGATITTQALTDDGAGTETMGPPS